MRVTELGLRETELGLRGTELGLRDGLEFVLLSEFSCVLWLALGFGLVIVMISAAGTTPFRAPITRKELVGLSLVFRTVNVRFIKGGSAL